MNRRTMCIVALAFASASCRGHSVRSSGTLAQISEPRGTLAQVFYWRARPGMLDAYNRYITEVAEPIDAEAQQRGAFISVTTFMTRDTLSPWTHMRVFVLRDSAQLLGLSAALEAAGARLEPDSSKRRVRGEYAATLRDRVGSAVLDILP